MKSPSLRHTVLLSNPGDQHLPTVTEEHTAATVQCRDVLSDLWLHGAAVTGWHRVEEGFHVLSNAKETQNQKTDRQINKSENMPPRVENKVRWRES